MTGRADSGMESVADCYRRGKETIFGRYYAEARIFSLPLFERFGFRQTGSERADRCGDVTFERLLDERVASRSV